MPLKEFLTRRRKWSDPAPLAALSLLFGGALLCAIFSPPRSKSPRAQADKHLAEARSQTDAALERHLKAVRAVFERGRKGAPAFAADALSWSGKFALIKGTLGIGEGDAHAAFLAQSFAKHVFSADALEAAIQGAIKGYLSDIDAIENQLLVQLRADLSDSELGRGKLPVLASDHAFQEEYRRLAASVTRTMHLDTGVEVGRQVAGLVAMDVATPIVIRLVEVVAAEMGLEAGSLTTGAASGAATLGIGLIVGIVADQIIAWLLKQGGYDPELEIAEKVSDSLDYIEKLLIDGTPEKAGLRRELGRIGRDRSAIQSAVINKLLKEGGAS